MLDGCWEGKRGGTGEEEEEEEAASAASLVVTRLDTSSFPGHLLSWVGLGRVAGETEWKPKHDLPKGRKVVKEEGEGGVGRGDAEEVSE